MREIRERIRSAQSICILTGAGVSAESGIPTFRSAGGLWRNFRPEDLATPDAFARDPKLVWEWYDWRRGLIAKAEPNPGHHAAARFPVITQNVDGLHQRAGAQACSNCTAASGRSAALAAATELMMIECRCPNYRHVALVARCFVPA